MVSFPRVPPDTPDVHHSTREVLPIQVGMLAAVVPPGPMIVDGTISAVIRVMVAILRAERVTVVVGE